MERFLKVSSVLAEVSLVVLGFASLLLFGGAGALAYFCGWLAYQVTNALTPDRRAAFRAHQAARFGKGRMRVVFAILLVALLPIGLIQLFLLKSLPVLEPLYPVLLFLLGVVGGYQDLASEFLEKHLAKEDAGVTQGAPLPLTQS
ncbi:hypothetical protein [Roseospira visakhapatnamensis]|uniref:Uncharacterized protein n=1 Tax=Roseospira visakhapatnamensis TaxID=390880 RepID=A0A7W6RH64_9PROT|nr:hypothetical protein [Roseospira visakhapatnamensis]MBB4268257.1 hypothetical protein [Roseospira visakhapatnamensis]